MDLAPAALFLCSLLCSGNESETSGCNISDASFIVAAFLLICLCLSCLSRIMLWHFSFCALYKLVLKQQ